MFISEQMVSSFQRHEFTTTGYAPPWEARASAVTTVSFKRYFYQWFQDNKLFLLLVPFLPNCFCTIAAR